MRRLLGCSIRHLLPLSIKLISLLIIHVFHTLCLSVFSFQDDISFYVDLKAIATARGEHQMICRRVYSQGKGGLPARPLLDIPLDIQKSKSPETCLVMQTSSKRMLYIKGGGTVVSAPNKKKSWHCTAQDHIMEAIT